MRFLILAALVGCHDAGPSTTTSQRLTIVSLSPALTDTLAALGASDHLVGVSRYCNMPRGVVLPRLGGVQDRPLEAIGKLKPSLIITSDSRRGPADTLERAGFPVRRFSEGGLEAVLATFGQLANAIGRPKQGAQLTAQVRADLAQLAHPITSASRSILVVFSSQGEPVSQAWAVGAGGWLNDIISHVGLMNPLGSEGLSYVQLSTEGIIELQPEIIVELHGEANDNAAPMSKRWGALTQLPAVRNGRLYRYHGEALLRPGPRLVELAKILAKLR